MDLKALRTRVLGELMLVIPAGDERAVAIVSAIHRGDVETLRLLANGAKRADELQ
jgi:hypothetical protein